MPTLVKKFVSPDHLRHKLLKRITCRITVSNGDIGVSIYSVCRFTVRLPADDDSDNENMVTESGEEGSENSLTNQMRKTFYMVDYVNLYSSPNKQALKLFFAN